MLGSALLSPNLECSTSISLCIHKSLVISILQLFGINDAIRYDTIRLFPLYLANVFDGKTTNNIYTRIHMNIMEKYPNMKLFSIPKYVAVFKSVSAEAALYNMGKTKLIHSFIHLYFEYICTNSSAVFDLALIFFSSIIYLSTHHGFIFLFLSVLIRFQFDSLRNFAVGKSKVLAR